MSAPWTRQEAIDLCREIEKVAPLHSCHVALTGGCLYKAGHRKDLDILFYRIRQAPEIEVEGLIAELAGIGIELVRRCSPWCFKFTFDGRPIDAFFPEEIIDGQACSEGDDYTRA